MQNLPVCCCANSPHKTTCCELHMDKLTFSMQHKKTWQFNHDTEQVHMYTYCIIVIPPLRVGQVCINSSGSYS